MLNKIEIEKKVVERFLKNNNKSFCEAEIITEKENDIVDIVYKEKKFQITLGEHESIKTRHIIPKNTIKFLPSKWPDDIFIDIFLIIKEKNKKYGKSANGVILLISLDTNYSEPLWLKDDINNNRLRGWDYNFYFDEIYLVCPNENIKVYP